jgi:3',5'-cyclic AMP phosphodiesterase CpdA
MDLLRPDQTSASRELLYFWAFGDLHYRTIPSWHEQHTKRLAMMYEDIHELWNGEEGQPAFCVSPGDIVDTCAVENYRLAKASIEEQLGSIPFYPGVGNHEYYGPNGEDPARMVDTYIDAWEKPLRYSWQAGEAICIMLDYPDPLTLDDPKYVYLSEETLTFLDTTLATYAAQPAIIFLHCPLYDTVLDRDPEKQLDYNSLQHFFAPENSQEVRDILTRHPNACLFFSGHTHSGWQAPNLVKTEQLGKHAVTFINLMSPWYTGWHKGPSLSRGRVTYALDMPDMIPTFAVRLFAEEAVIRVREHRTKTWLKEWRVSLR